MSSEITKQYRLTIMGLMILFGALNIISYKFQNKQYVYEGGYYKYFYHPFMQATTMFFGEFMVLLVYLSMKKRDPEGFRMRALEARSKGKIIEFNKLWLAIPAASDLIASTMQCIALNFISGSVLSMMRGGSIVTTLIFSKLFLKVTVLKNQILGAAMVLIGVTIVGMSNTVFAPDISQAEASLQILGYILIALSLFTNGFLFVFEQKLLSKYHLEPLQVVGYEGLFGLCLEIMLLPIMAYLPCSFGISACVLDNSGMPFFELPLQYYKQVTSSSTLVIFGFLGILSIATFNIAGITVTKYINALARSIGDVSRTLLVWIIGIVVTITIGQTKANYKWELIDTGAILLEFGGFIVLVCGNLIYNQVIKVPCWSEEEDEELLKSHVSLLTEGESDQEPQ